jgi:PAS domain S-box-containing protein
VLDDAFEHAAVPLVVLDAGGEVLHANRAFAALVGRDDVTGRDVRSLLAPGERDEPWADLTPPLAGPVTFAADRRWRRPDGALINSRVEGTLFADADGMPTHAVVVVQQVATAAAAVLDPFRAAVISHVAQLKRYGAEGAILAVDAPADVVRSRMRSSDVVGRAGGHTCVLLPRGTEEGARSVARLLERAVGCPVSVTPFLDPDDADDAIARAVRAVPVARAA